MDTLYVTLLKLRIPGWPDAYVVALIKPPVKPKEVRELAESNKVGASDTSSLRRTEMIPGGVTSVPLEKPNVLFISWPRTASNA